MVNIFIDREAELGVLEEQFRRKAPSFVVLYGRRRVGKTALISRFIQGKKALYFLATEESEVQNCNAFRLEASDFSGNELLKYSRLDDWLLIFRTLIDENSNKKEAEQRIIVLDEFQYLVKSNSAFPSIMQKAWDTILNKAGVLLILCGSSVSMMESSVLNYSSPLYGRRTAQIKLQQIPFSHYKKFFPGKTEKELIELYAVTGGIPKYIEFFEGAGTLYEKINKNIVSTSGFLYNEPAFLLQMEVSEIGSYFSLIKTIAQGNHKLSQIAAALAVKQTTLSKYLNVLATLDIIEREVPVTDEKPEKSKRGLYRIKDNFLQFWFKFIFPNLNYIEIGKPAIVEKIIKKNFIDTQVSFVYEDVCRLKMWDINLKKRWGFTIDRCGRWWNNNEEIDIVAYDSTGVDIVFGECKYTVKKTGLDVLKTLETKSMAVQWNNEKRRSHFILFSINGYTDELVLYAKTRKDLLLY
jgi:AAA+ ATPase superfamily predicted ATPase